MLAVLSPAACSLCKAAVLSLPGLSMSAVPYQHHPNQGMRLHDRVASGKLLPALLPVKWNLPYCCSVVCATHLNALDTHESPPVLCPTAAHLAASSVSTVLCQTAVLHQLSTVPSPAATASDEYLPAGVVVLLSPRLHLHGSNGAEWSYVLNGKWNIKLPASWCRAVYAALCLVHSGAQSIPEVNS